MKLSGPKLLLHIEGLVVFCTACVMYRVLSAPWSKFVLLFLIPDLPMLGYLSGRKVGAWVYNSAHTYLAPFVLWLVLFYAHRSSLFPLCLIWVAHIGFDRLLGYGLKYDADFKDTHLSKV